MNWRRLFALIFLSAPIQSQDVDLKNAQCGFSSRGAYICDFEYHLRRSVELYSSTVALRTDIHGGGSYSLSEKNGAYTIGGLGRGSFWGMASTEVGRTAMTMRFYAPYFPGVYENSRGEAARPSFHASELAFQSVVKKLQTTVAEISEAQSKYTSDIAHSAVKAYSEQLNSINAQVEARLATVLPKAQYDPKEWSPVARADIADTMPALTARVASVDEKQDSISRWEALEKIWQVGVSGTVPLLPAADAAAVTKTYEAYFNEQGLVSQSLVGKESAQLSADLAAQLQTPPASREGIEIRRQLNRGLVAYDSLQLEELRAKALGGMALAMGADQAQTAGENEAARTLLQQSTAVLDTVLGFVPVVSSINDATQIVWGIAFGHDYNGNEMKSGDFALRGLGIVLGLVPAKAVVQVGKKTFGKLFASGASIMRRFGLSKRFGTIIEKEAGAAKEIAEAVGHYADEGASILEEFVPRRRAEQVAKILEAHPGVKEVVARELVEIKDLAGPAFFKDGFLEHYTRHVLQRGEFTKLGIKTPKQYVLGAQNLIANKTAKNVLRPDGRVMYFLEETGEFAVLEKDKSTIVTYFIPEEGLQYWLEQLKKISGN